MTDNRIELIKNTPNGFCLAKWYQVTIDLSRGYTHSCHHPERHHIPLDEINQNVSALHNTQFKMLQRQMMLNGIRPPECEYCWKIEDTPGEHISDRFIKSTDEWAFPLLEETLNLPWDQMVSPTYLEVIFSSICNLSCIYCMADTSTSIEEEMKKFGPYPVTSNQHRMPNISEIKDDNPYVKAFWQWFPTILNNLKVFRITGGEPLLSKETFLILDFLETHPNSNLELALNTNLSYSPNQTTRLLAQVKVLLAKNSIRKFTLFTSIDGFGSEAIYIRKGLVLNKFLENISIISDSLPETEIVFMCTYNILSITSFRILLDWIADKKRSDARVTLDISYLKDPEYLGANLATEDLKLIMNNDLIYMKSLVEFTTYEIKKFERLTSWVNNTTQDKKILTYRSDFFTFINEFDKRYGINFRDTFSNHLLFYKICQKANYWSTIFNNRDLSG